MTEVQIKQIEDRLWADLRERGVPGHIHEGIVAHVMNGRGVGSFLTAVFENKLSTAFMRADDMNERAMGKIVAVMYYDVPGACWGSKEKVKAWREKGGIRGSEKGAEDGD